MGIPMIDQKSLRTLEFHKVLAKIENYTSFSGGAALVRALTPTSYADEAQAWQRETGEARAMFEAAAQNDTRYRLETASGEWMDSRDLARRALAMLDKGEFASAQFASR